jgi:hypothetical protein
LLLSSKLSAALLSVIVIAVFVIADWIGERRIRVLAIARDALAIVAIAFLMGGWCYVRNFKEYGNAFYPFEATVAGLRMPGPIARSSEMIILNREFAQLPARVRLWRLWREEKSHYGLWLYNADSAYAGFGPIFLVLGIPSLATACFLSLLDRRWLAAAVLFLVTGAYLTFSGNISSRLSLFILPGVAAGMALVLTAIEASFPPRAGRRGEIFPSAILWLGFGLASYTFLAAAMSPTGPQAIRNQLFSSPREKDLAGGTFLNSFAQVRTDIPLHASVAYDASTAFLWPLWRPDWKNDVHFIPTAGGWEKWRVQAETLGITHVAVARPGKSTMDEWIGLHGEHFRYLAAGGFGALYGYTR